MTASRLWHSAFGEGQRNPMSVVRRGFLALPPNVRQAALHGLGRYAPWEARFDFSPPALGPNEEAGAPDFVGIGVQKAGTTWWYTLILSHPDVSSRSNIHKERHFFDRFGSRSFATSDISDYHGWFPRSPGTRAGEWTPDYFSYAWVPPLLHRAALTHVCCSCCAIRWTGSFLDWRIRGALVFRATVPHGRCLRARHVPSFLDPLAGALCGGSNLGAPVRTVRRRHRRSAGKNLRVSRPQQVRRHPLRKRRSPATSLRPA